MLTLFGNRNHPRKHCHLLEPALTEQNGLVEGIACTILIISSFKDLVLNLHNLNACMKHYHCMYIHLFSLYFKIILWPYFSCFAQTSSNDPNAGRRVPWLEEKTDSPMWLCRMQQSIHQKLSPESPPQNPYRSAHLHPPIHTHTRARVHTYTQSLWEIGREESLQTKTDSFILMGMGSIHGFYSYVLFFL